ncbi:MAG: hypothetical protein ACLP01_11645 [Solirubrobacteraceae bacterium]
MRELVLAALSPSDKRLLLEGGTPRHELSSSSGPLRPEVTLRRREILVSQYTPAAWRSHLAWHSYWDRHGGFGGANLDDEQLMAASPPTPSSDHRKVRLTWGQARTWVREDTAQQECQSRASRDTSRTPRVAARAGLSSRTRHDLDRAAQQLRDRFAYRPSRRALADAKWAWTDAAAQGCEVSIREVLADAACASIDVDAVQRRSRAVLEVAHGLLGGDTSLPPASATHATRRLDPHATGGCAWCPKPMPPGVRPEAKFCSKRCRQAASRARLKTQPARSPSPPPETCAWCPGPMPKGVRPEARFCSKRCRQAASRFDLAVQRALRPAGGAAGPGDASPPRGQRPRCDQLRDGPLELRARTVELVDAFLAVERECFGAWCVLFDRRGTLDPDAVVASQDRVHAAAERLRSWCANPDLRKVAELDATRRACSPSSRPCASRPAPEGAQASRAMRFGYADPPYPGKSRVYRDHPDYAGEVDHAALISRLITEFPDGWALSTSAQALQDILALCPPGVRVCSWHRPVRRTRSRRPLSAWEPLIVCGGRELPAARPQTVTDALEYRGRFRAFPGAITGMKAPQYAAWAFAQLGMRAGDELVDLFPGSGAVSEAWRRYTAAAPNDTSSPPAAAGAPVSAGDVSPTPAITEVLSDASRGSSRGSPGDVGRDPSPAPPATSGSVVGEVSQCLECFGYSEPCAACVAAAGDPRPEEFAVRVAGIPGGQVDGTRRCGCGRVYGTYHAGSLLCFVMQAPGRRQVNACVRCGAQLAATTTTDCTPPATDAAAPPDTSRQVRRAA